MLYYVTIQNSFLSGLLLTSAFAQILTVTLKYYISVILYVSLSDVNLKLLGYECWCDAFPHNKRVIIRHRNSKSIQEDLVTVNKSWVKEYACLGQRVTSFDSTRAKVFVIFLVVPLFGLYTLLAYE